MWKLNKPAISAKDSFTKSISRMRNGQLKSRLQAITALIESGSLEFDTNGAASTLHNFPRIGTGSVAHVTAKEMATVYDQRFAAKNSPGRYIYDQILSEPANACCPLCGHRDATTLDHHLPKMEYPVLAVSPSNLVPACMECNKLKGEYFPNDLETQTLHPYFDDISTEQWLKARVIQTNPSSLVFFVDKPASWATSFHARIENHFKKFGLNKLYATQAATELSSVRKRSQDLLNSGGSNGVRDHFIQEALSKRAAALNSWRTATYEAISQSQWYCSGNF